MSAPVVKVTEREAYGFMVGPEVAARFDFWPTREELDAEFTAHRLVVLPNGHMLSKSEDHYTHWATTGEWPECWEGGGTDLMAIIDPLRAEAEEDAKEEAASQARQDEAIAARQAEADRLARIEASRVVKVTEVSGHFYVEPYEAMGIVDDDGGHMITFDELLPEGVEGKRGRFRVVVSWEEER